MQIGTKMWLSIFVAVGFITLNLLPAPAWGKRPGPQTREELIAIRGNVGKDGTVEAGSGFRAVRVRNGLYLIIFDHFFGQPTVTSLLFEGFSAYGDGVISPIVDAEVTDESGACQAGPDQGTTEIVADQAQVACMKVQAVRISDDVLVDAGFMFVAYVSQ